MIKKLIVWYLLVTASFCIASKGNDLQTVKIRIVAELLTGGVNDDEVKNLINKFSADSTWPCINYRDVSNTGFEHRFHLGNMVTLAKAYNTENSRFYRDEKVGETVEKSLAFWVKNDFICENWWHNQIGTPNSLVQVLLLMGDVLPTTLVDGVQPVIQRAHVDAPGARPGGDRIKIAGIQAKNMLFLGDGATFERIIRVIENEIKYVEWIGMHYGYTFRNIDGGFANRSAAGRGIQYDNSFHHRTDGVNNTLSYGRGYASAFIEWAVYVEGTNYAFSDEKIERLVDYFLDGICKTAVFGKYPDAGAKNRSFSRPGALHPYNATTAKMLLQTTGYRENEIREIAEIREKNSKPTLSHATFYWHSEHFTFQRPEFFTSVRMYSTRTHNMEQPYNSEGLFNHHRGDGSNHISCSGTEYNDIAPVFDYQKIPGTTVLQKQGLPSENEIQKIGLTDFVGAATDGMYAAVGFDFKSPHDPLCARKGWFFFDKEYVCLGAGISARANLSVVTTLNQCLLKTDVTVSAKDKKTVLENGEAFYENVNWVFQDGTGYVFPESSGVYIQNNTAQGSWYDINRQTDSPKDILEKEVFKIWLDHGTRASDETYEYIIVPATSVEALEQNQTTQNIEILSNTPELQAVKHSGLGMVQAVFYKAGTVQVTDKLQVGCDSPGIIMLKYKDQKLVQITISDPNRELKRMHVSVSTVTSPEGDHYSSVWNPDRQMSDITIRLPRGVYAGKSITVNF